MEVRGSGASPFARLPMVLALAGTMTIRSALSARSMWPGFQDCFSSSSETRTGFLERTCRVRGVMNSVADCVMTTCTACPSLMSWEVMSAAL